MSCSHGTTAVTQRPHLQSSPVKRQSVLKKNLIPRENYRIGYNNSLPFTHVMKMSIEMKIISMTRDGVVGRTADLTLCIIVFVNDRCDNDNVMKSKGQLIVTVLDFTREVFFVQSLDSITMSVHHTKNRR